MSTTRNSSGRAGWTPPAQVDEYRLVRPLGQGGMGFVYVARDTLLDRQVAVKFISALEPDGMARQRFQNEARALARLQHANVVTIHRVGEVDGRPYLVCELVEGKSLAQLDLPLPASRVIEIAVGAVRGLAAVHRHGLLHRDVKPGNIAFMPNGVVKLLDFGLATLAETADAVADWSLSDAGEVVGTRAYLAPEVRGGGPATRRSDIYSLGAVLYELYMGNPPRPGRPILGRADPGLAAVIERCLAQEPELRYASADQLRDALEQLLPGPREAAVPEGNPYRGLRPFEAEHRSFFFGRQAESRAVLDQLRSEPLLLVTGDSGVGKSSLCRAGVLPLVAEGQLDPTRVWKTVTLVPGRRPVISVAAALADLLSLSEEGCADLVRAEPASLGRALRRRRGDSEGLVVFLDQAEELCTLSDPVEAAQTTECLASLGQAGLRVLVAVRGDFFTRVAALPGLADGLPGSLYLLRRLSTEQIREAVVGPARRAGARFESEALVDTLVADAAGAPGGVALLQFALAELWEARDAERQIIPAAALASVGGVVGALARHADGLLAGLPPEQRAAVPRILTRLVTAEGARVRRTARELGLDDAGRLALEALVKGRLLVAAELEGDTTYELSHEALIAGWATLRDWLASDAETRATRHRLVASAAEWERLGRDRSVLWNARQLVEVDRLDRGELPAHERAFLDASLRMARRHRQGRIALGVSALAFAGVVYGGVRWQARSALEETIAARRRPAERSLGAARAEADRADALRQEAFARFRAPTAGSQPPATVWQDALADYGRALALDEGAEAKLVQVSQALEAALLLDPDDPTVRDLLGNVTFLRLVIAERTFRTQPRDELRFRFRNFAATRPQHVDLDAPATLAIATSLPGARVRLERYDVPINGGNGRRIPWPAGDLGVTPISPRSLPPGSYRLTFEQEGRATVRYPILLARAERVEVKVELPAADNVPDGYVYVPPGRFLFGSADPEGLRRFLGAPPQHQVETNGYLIGRNEVTFGEYLAYLRDLPPAARADHTPRVDNAIRGSLRLEEVGARYRLTIAIAGAKYSAMEGEPIRYDARDRRAVQDWTRFPMSGISWLDAQAYVAWLSRTERLAGARLCSEHEWERAARGADDRIYPHGDRLEPDDANHDATYGRRPEAFGPDEVGSHPVSDSPFGVQDLVGNVFEWADSIQNPGEPTVRGGSFFQEEFTNRSTNRDVGEPRVRDVLVGMRVCASFPSFTKTR